MVNEGVWDDGVLQLSVLQYMISVHSPLRQLVVEPMFDDAAQKYVIEYGVPPMLALSDVVFKKKLIFLKKWDFLQR